MFITKISLPRRTFLRGMGAVVALPLLEAMVPALTALAKTAAAPATRSARCSCRNGAIMEQWSPATTGAGFEFTPILKPLERFRDSLVVVSNLTRAHPGVVEGDHAISAAGWLSGVLRQAHRRPRTCWAGRRSIRSSRSRSARTRRFRRSSWRPRTSPATSAPARSGYSCAYMNTISWSTPTTPLPMEINPRVVFERLFGRPGTPAQRPRGCARNRSILDLVTKQARRPAARSRRARSRRGWASISTTSARSSGASSGRNRIPAPGMAFIRRAGRRARVVRGAPGADVRPAGRRLSGRPDSRVHVHERPRAQPADLSADRRHRAAPHGVASRERSGEDRRR